MLRTWIEGCAFPLSDAKVPQKSLHTEAKSMKIKLARVESQPINDRAQSIQMIQYLIMGIGKAIRTLN